MSWPTWVWVSTPKPQMQFGLISRDGVIVDAASVARWAIGRSETDVAAQFRGQGATFVPHHVDAVDA